MKILILKNGISNEQSLESGFAQAISLCKSIGLNLEIVYQTVDKIFDSQRLSSDVVVNGFGINPKEILDSATGTADVVCLISSYAKVRPFNFSVTNPINPCTYDLDRNTLDNALVMQICEEWY